MSDADTPPYAQIAAELRTHIRSGDLAAGERVPSTREITRRWGVAMATATKALTALRQEGLVRAVSGVGTVVEPAPGRAVPGSSSTTRGSARETTSTGPTQQRIVAAALAVADTEGLGAVSMRRVAAEIGVATMALYRHVSDKDDLLLAMMDAAFAESRLPPERPDDWRAAVELAARTLWATFRRHPWLAPSLSLTRPDLIPHALPYTEWVLAALDGHGLDMSTMLTAHLTLFSYVRGTAVHIELEEEARARTGVDHEEWMGAQQPRLQALLATDDFPMFNRLFPAGYDFDLDALFEFGLQRFLDGLAALIGSVQEAPVRRGTPRAGSSGTGRTRAGR